MTMDHVVVHDPEGIFWEGSLVKFADVAALEARGVATLPLDTAKLRQSYLAGWAKRSWGAGWPLDGAVPVLCCRTMLDIEPGETTISWTAELIPSIALTDALNDEQKRAALIPGLFTMASDSGQRGALCARYAPNGDAITMRNLPRPTSRGTYLVKGSGTATTVAQGPHGFALVAALTGMRAIWLAIAGKARSK